MLGFSSFFTGLAFLFALIGRRSLPAKIAFIPIGLSILAHLGTLAMHGSRLWSAL